VAYVNTGATGVIEHTHSNVLGLIAIQISFICLVFIPVLLPFVFDFFWIIALHLSDYKLFATMLSS